MDRPPRISAAASRWVFALRYAPWILEATGWSLWYRLLGRRSTFSRVVAPFLTTPAAAPSERSRVPAAALERTVAIATRWGPLRTTCLVRSLTLARMMRRAGYVARVRLGVAETGSEAGRWFAHAWVESTHPQHPPGYLELERFLRGPAVP